MKKLTILLFFALVGFTTVNAQVEQIVNKNGVAVMPEAGQFAIGFDALPFFGYVGDMFNNTTNNNLFATYVSNNSGLQVYGKYFLSESNAIRGRVRINQNITQDVNRVFQDGQANPQDNIEVEDELISSSFTLELGGGMEWRRGKGRLVGVYGGEAFVGLNTSSQTFTYGNAITADNQAPTTTTNFNSGASGARTVRTVSITNPNSFSVGARGFAGVEYFFAPQISIGAEFYLGIGFTGTNRSEVVTEEWNADAGAVQLISDVNANVLTQFGINTSDYGGAINLLFHF
jgi:hypothetical protein